MSVRSIDHTADIGFEVRSMDRSALFEECALVLARSIASEHGLEPGEEHSVDVTAGSLEDLMVDWLEEQVFLCDTRGFLMLDCYVEIRDEAEGDVRLLGVLRGDRYTAERHHLKVQVKAVTYHGLKVELRDDEWFARIILDI